MKPADRDWRIVSNDGKRILGLLRAPTIGDAIRLSEKVWPDEPRPLSIFGLS